MPVGTFPCRGHHLVKHERSTRPSVELLSEEIFQNGHSVSRERLHFGEKLNVWDICRKTVLQTNLIIHEPLHTWNAVFVGYVGKLSLKLFLVRTMGVALFWKFHCITSVNKTVRFEVKLDHQNHFASWWKCSGLRISGKGFLESSSGIVFPWPTTIFKSSAVFSLLSQDYNTWGCF